MPDNSLELLNAFNAAIQNVQELTLRIDERTKHLIEMQSDQDMKMRNMAKQLENIVSRVSVLEARSDASNRQDQRIAELERTIDLVLYKNKAHESNINRVLDIVGRVVWVAVASYVLYKLNVPAAGIS